MRISGGGGSGTPTGWPLAWWCSAIASAPAQLRFAQTANFLNLLGFVLPCALSVSKIILHVLAADAGGNYDVGLYSNAGVLLGDIGAQHLPSTGIVTFTFTGGALALPPGRYYLGTTGTAITATYAASNPSSGAFCFVYANSSIATTGGVLPASVTPPADSIEDTLFPGFALSA